MYNDKSEINHHQNIIYIFLRASKGEFPRGTMGVTAGLFFCAVYYAGANMANGKTRMGFCPRGGW